MNTTQFIIKANLKHKGKYDYSLVDYKNNRTKVKIICPKHKVFEQIAKNHLQGYGCLKCAQEARRKTTEQFIKEAKEIHGDKYDYSLVDYKTTDTKIKIICPKHSIFEQTPDAHLQGEGCPDCWKERRGETFRKTTEQFIKEAKEVHDNKYDYSLVDYKTNKTKVIIICPKHGKFLQMPIVHLIGCGCQKCSNKHKYTTEEFIKNSITKYGNKFSYENTNYINYYTKVKIKCNKHNFEFETLPTSHLNLDGCCPLCRKEKISKLLSMSEKEFFKKCSEIHNFEYDYSKSKYLGCREYITYICPIHKEIKQVAYYHINGIGCPYCNASKGEKRIKQFLDTNKISLVPWKTFNNLKNKGKLSYDFYLPDFNLLIEYNGEQHYEFIPYFHRKLHNFHKQLHHDWLKRKYAIKNNYELLVIPYWDFNNIEKILGGINE